MKQTRRVFAATGMATLMGASLTRAALADSTPEASPVATGTRTITTVMGDVEIPANPQRVVVLDGPVLDAAIALGVIPVGATTGVANDPWPAYLGDATAGITNVGEIVAPDLELIVSLEPDLIIGVKSRHEEIFPQLSEIAPTVFVEEHRIAWRENFLVFADALNRNDQVEAVAGAFDTRTAEIRSALEADGPLSASVLRLYTDVIYAYQTGSFSGSILEAVGLQRPEGQSDPAELAVELSGEQLIEADADVLFIAVWADETTTDVATLTTNPLWESLSAVQADKVYLVPDETWMVAMGYIAAGFVLDDIQAYLVDGVPPAELG